MVYYCSTSFLFVCSCVFFQKFDSVFVCFCVFSPSLRWLWYLFVRWFVYFSQLVFHCLNSRFFTLFTYLGSLLCHVDFLFLFFARVCLLLSRIFDPLFLLVLCYSFQLTFLVDFSILPRLAVVQCWFYITCSILVIFWCLFGSFWVLLFRWVSFT